MANPSALDELGGDWSGLPLETQAKLSDIVISLVGGQSLREFIAEVRPHEEPPPHLQLLIAAFERARRERVRICVSMPPRAGKSVTVKSALAWWLKNRPAELCCYASYNSDFAQDQSRDVRDLALSCGVRLAADATASGNWRTPQGGGLFAAGLNAGITGRGVTGIAVVDDPYANPEQARSPAMRDAVQRNFDRVIATRMEGWAGIIVVHTRWDTQDLIGTLEKRGGWEVINIPALARRGDPVGRQPGEPLWPERPQFTKEALEELKRIDPFGFESLYQGQPIPDGQRIFYADPKMWDPKKTDLTGCTVIIGGDPAATKKNSADFSACVAMAVRPPFTIPTVYILDVWRKQDTVPAVARAMAAFQKKWYGAPLKVESVAGFKAVPQILRELVPGMRVDEINPVGDKIVRAQLFAAAWNDGRVLLPMTDPSLRNSTTMPDWVKEYTTELREFTGRDGQHDDQVDASAHAYNEIPGLKRVVKRASKLEPGVYGA